MNYKEVKPTSFVEEMNKNLISENNLTPYKINPTENLFVSPDKKRYFQNQNQANLNKLKEVSSAYIRLLLSITLKDK